jgi:putative nucleotidyltransferase with HDIG domain
VTREEAWPLVQSLVGNRNLQKHMLATEVCLRALAPRLGGDVELWGLAGLVHDLDYEQTKADPDRHGIVGAGILEDKGVDPAIIHAVKSHAGNAPVESTLDKTLYAADPLTGLIVAAALMHPTKKLAGLDTEFVLRRFKEKKFAAGADRDQIRTCTDLDMTLDQFITVCLGAMQDIADQLGL